MDNHFPDDMSFWSERPSLPNTYKPPKKKLKLVRKDVRYNLIIGEGLKRMVTYYVLGIPVYKKTKTI
jgi:hypothetical protein